MRLITKASFSLRNNVNRLFEQQPATYNQVRRKKSIHSCMQILQWKIHIFIMKWIFNFQLQEWAEIFQISVWVSKSTKMHRWEKTRIVRAPFFPNFIRNLVPFSIESLIGGWIKYNNHASSVVQCTICNYSDFIGG